MKKFNLTGYQVLTPSGFQPFHGMVRHPPARLHRVVFDDGNDINVTCDHRFISIDGGEIRCRDLHPGVVLASVDGVSGVVESVIDTGRDEEVYDLLEVAGGHTFYTNGVESHNCEMLSSDAMLISSLVLQYLRGTPPVKTDMGFSFWETKFNPKYSYYVGCDIATGNGQDYSTIQVVEFPTLRQVAEWRHNNINIPRFYAHIKWIISHILTNYDERVSRQPPEVMWSYETNGVGAAIHALYHNDDKFPDAMLVSDAHDKPGICTTGKKKVLACMDLKNLVERKDKGLIVNSKVLLTEMKNFVAKKGNYEARPGATDDLVSAMLVIMNMFKKATEFDQTAFDVLYAADTTDISSDYGNEEPIGMAF
jgi:hypothetical protein